MCMSEVRVSWAVCLSNSDTVHSPAMLSDPNKVHSLGMLSDSDAVHSPAMLSSFSATTDFFSDQIWMKEVYLQWHWNEISNKQS